MGKDVAKASALVRELTAKIIEEVDSLVDLDAQGDYNLKCTQVELGARCAKAEARMVELEQRLHIREKPRCPRCGKPLERVRPWRVRPYEPGTVIELEHVLRDILASQEGDKQEDARFILDALDDGVIRVASDGEIYVTCTRGGGYPEGRYRPRPKS